MLKDGLLDVDKLRKEDTLEDDEKDTIEAKYFKVVNSVSFLDIATCIEELPISENGRPKVKEAKILRSAIFLTMTSSKRWKIRVMKLSEADGLSRLKRSTMAKSKNPWPGFLHIGFKKP